MNLVFRTTNNLTDIPIIICTSHAACQSDNMYPLHRLDVDTEGLMVLGKSHDFASHFNLLIRKNMVKRRYRTLLASTHTEALPGLQVGISY